MLCTFNFWPLKRACMSFSISTSASFNINLAGSRGLILRALGPVGGLLNAAAVAGVVGGVFVAFGFTSVGAFTVTVPSRG